MSLHWKTHPLCRYMRPMNQSMLASNWSTQVHTFPDAPPSSGGSCATTLIVWASWVFPVRNSPYTGECWGYIGGQTGKTYLQRWTGTLSRLWSSISRYGHKTETDVPPRILSTLLLPVLIMFTLLRLSCTSTPVAKEEPYIGIGFEEGWRRIPPGTNEDLVCCFLYQEMSREHKAANGKKKFTLIFSTLASDIPSIEALSRASGRVKIWTHLNLQHLSPGSHAHTKDSVDRSGLGVIRISFSVICATHF